MAFWIIISLRNRVMKKKFNKTCHFLYLYFLILFDWKLTLDLINCTLNFIQKQYFCLPPQNKQIMRISTSPAPYRNKMVQRLPHLHEALQNSRSNSLSSTPIFSSKTQNPVQNCYISPYYNGNSSIRIVSQEQGQYEQKYIPTQSGIYENPYSFENQIKILAQKVQNIDKRLKRQQVESKTVQKQIDQKYLFQGFQQKINQEIQKKSVAYFEQLFQEIKKIQVRICEKNELSSIRQSHSIESFSSLENSKHKPSEAEVFSQQRKNAKIIEDKVKEEIFKLQIHLQNQITKSLNVFKNNDFCIEGNGNFPVLLRSKIKYKFRPIPIKVKNQVSVKTIEPQKKRKQTLSTTNSSNSSEQNQLKSEKKVIEFEQQVYFIDKEGYLLDQNGYYLLNEMDKMIKIDKHLLHKLKELEIVE